MKEAIQSKVIILIMIFIQDVSLYSWLWNLFYIASGWVLLILLNKFVKKPFITLLNKIFNLETKTKKNIGDGKPQ